MILKQYYLGCLSHASYLIGDENTRTAAVVDPQRDIEQYLADAKANNLDIKYVFLTHLHADFIAGHLELEESVNAEICMSAKASAEFEFTPLKEKDTIEFGNVKLEIMETPGHSPESISILVYDLEKNAEDPFAVLTGDTLFIGDVGRPDLRASMGWSATELGEMLYDSIHNKLMKIPDDTLVYPTHGAGSMCGKKLSKDTVSTMGIQKKYNYALQPMSREEFVRVVTQDQPDAPDYFTYNAKLNARERLTLEESIEKTLTPLTVEQVLELRDQGAQILDVRNPVEYEGAHLDGVFNIALDGKFATWAGTILTPDKPIVIISKPEFIQEAYTRLGRIGYDNIAGYLKGGMEALASRPDLVNRSERITPLTLADVMNDNDRISLVDVRTENEWKEGHIKNSKNIPLSQLDERLDEIDTENETVLLCGSGYRSSVAASILENRDISNFSVLVGGMSAWNASKLEVES